MTKWVLLCCALLCFGGTSSKAQPNSSRLYGWELDFTNSKLTDSNTGDLQAIANNANDKAREKWVETLKPLCKDLGCKIKEKSDWFSWYEAGEITEVYDVKSYRFQFEDGWWFQLSYDSGVVEVQIKPSTLADLQKHQKEIQLIFDTAKKAGLRPPKGKETHIHVGVEAAFGNDLHAFRNYMVDGVNHGEFPLLFARGGVENTAPLAKIDVELEENRLKKFGEIIEAIDRGEIKSIQAAAKVIRKKAYNVCLWPEEDMDGLYERPEKYQQHNVNRIREKMPSDEWTVEDRALPHPANAEEVLLLTQMKERRLEFLKKLGFKKVALRRINVKAKPQALAALFKQYVVEGGGEWGHYRRFLPKNLQGKKLKDLPPTALMGQRLSAPCSKALNGLLGDL